jgi:hypothetical protein
MLRKSCVTALAATSVAILVMFAGTSPSAAAPKISYEDAMKRCSSAVGQSALGDQASARYTAGSACMRKHGYRLKKSKRAS